MIRKLSILGLVLSVMLVLLWGCTVKASTTLEWTDSADHGQQGGTIEYRVYYGKASGVYDGYEVTIAHPYVINIPSNGEDNFYAVKGVDAGGNESVNFSNEVSSPDDNIPPLDVGITLSIIP